jgi:hypothetical protein
MLVGVGMSDQHSVSAKLYLADARTVLGMKRVRTTTIKSYSASRKQPVNVLTPLTRFAYFSRGECRVHGTSKSRNCSV